MKKRQWIRFLAVVPVWFSLAVSAASGANEPGGSASVINAPKGLYNCTNTREWDSSEKSYAYYFTCDFSDDESPASVTESPSAVYPSPSPSEESPSPSVEQSQTSLPTEPAPLPTPDITIPAPFPTPTDNVIDTSITYTTLDNGVVLPSDVADSLKVIDSPSIIFATAFKDPRKVLHAMSNVGLDMRPETRERAHAVVISAIIVVQIAGNVATMLVRKM